MIIGWRIIKSKQRENSNTCISWQWCYVYLRGKKSLFILCEYDHRALAQCVKKWNGQVWWATTPTHTVHYPCYFVWHCRPCLLKIPAVLQKAVLKILRCTVGVHFVSNCVPDLGVLKIGTQDHFRCVMVCYCTRTPQKTRPALYCFIYSTVGVYAPQVVAWLHHKPSPPSAEVKWKHPIVKDRVGQGFKHLTSDQIGSCNWLIACDNPGSNKFGLKLLHYSLWIFPNTVSTET